MLYDPKWNEPKPDIFALDTLIGWLEKKDPVGRYRYSSPSNCLLAQYFTDMFGLSVDVSRHYVIRDGIISRYSQFFDELPSGWDKIARGSDVWPVLTFGAALRRAKRLRLKVAVGSIWSRMPQLLGLT